MNALRVLTFASPLLAACGAFRGPSAPSPVASLRPVFDSLVADPRFRGAQWGILVVDPARGDTLYSHNAGKLFIPASNMKIVTGAVALMALGRDYRFSTMLSASHPITDGVIAGDLLVTGTGDPTVSDRVYGDAMIPLRALAESLAARGLRRVTGRLVNALDVFPGANLGPGWEWDDLRFAYAAGVDELFFNEGFARVRVRGGAAPGDSVVARTSPARTYPSLMPNARTGATADARTTRGIRVGYDSTTTGALVVDGLIAPGDSADATIAFRDQAHAYLSALREALADRGIAVEGGIEPRPIALTAHPANGDTSSVRQPPREPSGYPLVSTLSLPLRDILPHFEKPSQNQIGEILLRTIGRARTGVGLADSGLRVVRDHMLAWGVAPDAFVLRDGSGLSRHSVITPEAIVRVLAAMRTDSTFGTFYESLPVAGVDGTMGSRFRGTAVERNVHAKTGSLSMVRSLSGYITTRDGRMLVFSILANHWIVPVREVERVQDTILTRLANLTLGDR